MAANRIALSLGAVILFATALFFAANNVSTTPKTAVAGPCSDLTRLYSGWQQPLPGEDLQAADYFPGELPSTYALVQVVTNPFKMPVPASPAPTKPPVTIRIVGNPGHEGIEVGVYPETPIPPEPNGSFVTTITVRIDPEVPKGLYTYDIIMTCHGEESTVPLNIFVKEECPDGANANGIDVAFPAGQCSSRTPTPTPAVTPSTKESTHTWGDVDCDGQSNPNDALQILIEASAPKPSPTPSAGDCPLVGESINTPMGTDQWGDLDCSGDIDAIDSLAWLKWFALLQQLGLAPCPPVGVPVKVGSYYLLPN